MLGLPHVQINGEPVGFYTNLRGTEDLPTTLQFWTTYVARDLLRLGVYFQALGLMCQIPGGAHYRWVQYDDDEDDLPNENEDPRYWVGPADRDTAFNVLEECLRRLGAPDVMKQIPGGEDYEQEELSDEWKAYLDRQAKIEHGLLNVVAQCLDELVVEPGMEEIDVEPCATSWQRWWARMRESA